MPMEKTPADGSRLSFGKSAWVARLLFLALLSAAAAAHAATSAAIPASTAAVKSATPAKAESLPPSTADKPIDMGACKQAIEPLPIGGLNPDPYLAAADCLRLKDSVTAPSIRQGTADSVLRARLTDNKSWYLTHLDRFLARHDTPHALDMAFLAELKNLPDPAIYRELAEIYQMVPDPYRAGLAYLREAELDSVQTGTIQYQMGNLLRTASTDMPASDLLDSLTAGVRQAGPTTVGILESLCWGNRNYGCAYRNFQAGLAMRNPGPAAILDRVNRFQSLGYFDDAASLLEKLAWRNLNQPWQSMARALHLQIRYQLKDWPAIAAETEVTAGLHGPIMTDEEAFITATAFLKLGKPDQALIRLKRLEEKSTPPWGYRGRLLRAQALMSLGKPKEAAQTLDALKHDPQRQEGTGPILFWQGCLALDQGRFASAESLMVLASAYTGSDEAQRALEYRFFLLQDTSGEGRSHFFHGLPEAPRPAQDRMKSLDQVAHGSALWPFARIEKAQILVQIGATDSAEAVLDDAAKRSPDRLAGLQAEAKAAFLQEKLPAGRQAALARYEDLLIKYQQGVIPEFSRGRIKALK